MKQKIVLVDDDRNILTSVSMALESEGYTVKTFNDGESGLTGITKENPDLVILDIKMPRMDGTQVLQQLREKTQSLPVIFLTSKDDEQDEIFGLRLGADDYITKPFSQKLLIERINALLRRKNLETKPSPQTQSKIKSGNITLDDARFSCLWKNQPVDLTVTEYLIIKELATPPGAIKTREQLITAAYGETLYTDDRTIDSHIKRVRKKFKQIDETFDAIETRYGAGYTFKT